ncbi:hypothetical protein [Enhygromyxa salina]|nr:hypothetical protein [Enhygromyxa salina]
MQDEHRLLLEGPHQIPINEQIVRGLETPLEAIQRTLGSLGSDTTWRAARCTIPLVFPLRVRTSTVEIGPELRAKPVHPGAQNIENSNKFS